jgi:hypothetical protein
MSRIAVDFYHPALARLLYDQTKASLRRKVQRLSSRRRLVLSCLAIVLALFWLGNAALSILVRAPASAAHLRHWIPVGLFAYAVWHLLRVSYRRPEQGIEWSAAEREIFATAPFSRRQLLAYRLASVAGASAVKAGCFVLLMLPDLPHPLFGFVGFLLALLSIELWRMTVEITACQVCRTTYQAVRLVVLTTAAAALAGLVVVSCGLPGGPAEEDWASPLLPLIRAGHTLAGLADTPFGELVIAPFSPFANVMLADTVSLGWALQTLTAMAVTVALALVMSAIDSALGRRQVARQRHAYDRLPRDLPAEAGQRAPRANLPKLLRQRGWLALAWRQSLAAKHYWSSVGVAMAVPTFLALTPMLVEANNSVRLLGIVGGAAFYSLLLLPAAFRFDFRRDVDRMALLKSLPIGPSAMVVGQLLVPIVLTCLFQLLVFAVAAVWQPEHLGYAVVAWLVLVPMNVLVITIDNMIFLLFPHRLHQEGLEIFLRATLTFTAKGLLFALGVAVTAGWALSAARLARMLGQEGGATWLATSLFPFGMGLMLAVSAAVTFRLTVRAFRRYDPSQDAPA